MWLLQINTGIRRRLRFFSTVLPRSSTPRTTTTFFGRSIPTVVIFISVASAGWWNFAIPLWRSDALFREGATIPLDSLGVTLSCTLERVSDSSLRKAPRMKIDIDKLTQDELIDLNTRIVARLKFLHETRAHSQMLHLPKK
jgi:hypothetical protein